MTREQALRKARKKWGTKALIRASEPISSQEKREAAAATMRAARERRDAIDKEVAERLKTLDWYQALMAERKETVKTINEVQGWVSYFKFNVGYDAGIAFHISGYGDTWEQAFEKAEGAK